MKIKTKLPLISISIGFICFLTGCGATQYQRSLYSDDEKISNQSDSYSYSNRIRNSDSKYKQNIKYSDFYGDDTVWIISSKEDSNLSLSYDNELSSGEFKAVLIDDNRNVQTLFSGSKSGQDNIKLSKGDYRLKVVGKNAQGQIHLSINEDNNIEISRQKES